MGCLADFGIENAYHVTPLHYLPFIAKTGVLASKQALFELGFGEHHFRSTSRRQDIDRGFASYVHLCLDPCPPILRAKLGAGFPHVEIVLPTHLVETHPFYLCRFNIARTRYFLGAKRRPVESSANGRYYPELKLPIAADEHEKHCLLRENHGRQMIELLVPKHCPLSDEITITVFSNRDFILAKRILRKMGQNWNISVLSETLYYPEKPDYIEDSTAFIERALADTKWTGNGLEYDRV